MPRRGLVIAGLLAIALPSCAARMPTLEEVNEVVLRLREVHGFAWGLGVVAIWAPCRRPR